MQPSEVEAKSPEEVSWYIERYRRQLKTEEKEIAKVTKARKPKGGGTRRSAPRRRRR